MRWRFPPSLTRGRCIGACAAQFVPVLSSVRSRLRSRLGGFSLHDWFFRHGGSRKRVIDWLGIDAWIDSSLAQAWQSLQDRWNAFTSFFARFRLSGWKKLLNEVIAEGLTLGVGGLAVLFILAIPAINEFDENKINTGKYAVKFLDRNGNEIGQRGIL